MTEFRPLLDAIRVVQRRILANSLLHHWNRCLTWSLGGLLVAAAVLSLHALLVAAAVLAIVATLVAVVITWMARPSSYEAAWRLDQAAGLHDRLSTALHFAANERPDEMVSRQRRDALGRLAEADPRALFRMHLPTSLGRTAGIALAVVGMMLYQVNHKPPLLAVSEQVAQTRLARAILNPPPPEKEKEFKEKLLLTDDREAVDELDEKAGLDQASEGEIQETSEPANGDPSAPSDDPGGNEGQNTETESGNPEQSADGDQGSGDNQGDQQKGDRQDAGAQPQDKKSSSLAQKLTQALKDLMAKATGQQPRDQQNEQRMPQQQGNDPAQGQNQPQNPGNQNQGNQGARPPSQDSDAKANGSGPQMTNQQGEGNAPNGRGNNQSQLTKNPMLDANATADVVPLAATTFKGQASVLTTAQPGQALVPQRDTSALPTATTNGAEQGDVPLRYRAYIQQYFNHPDSNNPDKVLR